MARGREPHAPAAQKPPRSAQGNKKTRGSMPRACKGIQYFAGGGNLCNFFKCSFGEMPL